MNRIGILDGYGDYGAHRGEGKGKGRGKKHKLSRSKKAVAARARLKKASKACSHALKKNPRLSFPRCMSKKLTKKGRR